MDSMPAHRTSWKIRLVAFGIGIIVAAAVFGIALVISDDLRLLYLSGALLFAVAAFLLGTRAREDLIAAVLLLFASTFLFAFFVLSQTPFLWPTLLLWMAIVVWLLFRKRFARIIFREVAKQDQNASSMRDREGILKDRTGRSRAMLQTL